MAKPVPQVPHRDERCDYCGEKGCAWQNHAEARADVAAWQAEQAREEAM